MELTKEKKEYNHPFSKELISVEDIIKPCKILRITRNFYMSKHRKHGKVFNLITGLVNSKYRKI